MSSMWRVVGLIPCRKERKVRELLPRNCWCVQFVNVAWPQIAFYIVLLLYLKSILISCFFVLKLKHNENERVMLLVCWEVTSWHMVESASTRLYMFWVWKKVSVSAKSILETNALIYVGDVFWKLKLLKFGKKNLHKVKLLLNG